MMQGFQAVKYIRKLIWDLKREGFSGVFWYGDAKCEGKGGAEKDWVLDTSC